MDYLKVKLARIKMELMLKDAKEGKYVAPNRKHGKPAYNLDDLPASVTKYASL